MDKMLNWGIIKPEPGIYVIFNLITNDFYIGCSNNIRRRFYQHNSRSSNPLIRTDINKYGIEFFIFEPIKYGNWKELLIEEFQIIKNLMPSYNVMNKNNIIKKNKNSRLFKAMEMIANESKEKQRFYFHGSFDRKRKYEVVKKISSGILELCGSRYYTPTSHQFSDDFIFSIRPRLVKI